MHRQKKSSHGFTLIELLVVILIIGVGLSWGIIKTFDAVYHYRLRHTAERFTELLKFSRHQAIISYNVLNLTVSPTDTHALHLQLYYFATKPLLATGHWQLLPAKPPFKDFQLPSSLHITPEHRQQLIFYPNGQLSPFKFQFTTRQKNSMIYEILGHSNGKIELKHLRQ